MTLWNMYTGPALAAVDFCFSDDFSPFELFSCIAEDLSRLSHDVIYTFGFECEDKFNEGSLLTKKDFLFVLQAVVARLHNDKKLRVRNIFKLVLERSIKCVVQDLIFEPCNDEIDKVATYMVPPHLKDMCYIYAIGERAINIVINNILQNIVTQVLDNVELTTTV